MQARNSAILPETKEDQWLRGCEVRGARSIGTDGNQNAIIGELDTRERCWDNQIVLIEARNGNDVRACSGTFLRHLQEHDSDFGNDCEWVLTSAHGLSYYTFTGELEKYESYRLRILKGHKSNDKLNRLRPGVPSPQSTFLDLDIPASMVFLYPSFVEAPLSSAGTDIGLIRLPQPIFVRSSSIATWNDDRIPWNFTIIGFPMDNKKAYIQHMYKHSMGVVQKTPDIGYHNFGVQQFTGSPEVHRFVKYRAQTTSGMTGGPLLFEKNIVGVHTVGGDSPESGGTLLTEHVLSWIRSVQSSNQSELLCADIFECCRKGDLTTLEVILDQDNSDELPINVKDNRGISCVHYAASKGETFLLKQLLIDGASIAVTDNTGRTPLAAACWSGSMPVIELLLARKANINSKDVNQMMPLHVAAFQGHADVVEYLYKRGATLNQTMKNGCTEVHLACDRGHVKVIQLLMKTGSDFNVAQKKGFTALHYCCQYGFDKAIEELLAHKVDVDAPEANGLTPLHIACKFGRASGARILMKHGADMLAKTKLGSTSMNIACVGGHADVVVALLEAGFDITDTNDFGLGALHVTSQYGQYQVCKTLVEHKADPTHQNNNGQMPLHNAAQFGHMQVCKVLIELRADPRGADYFGNMALHVAAKYNQFDVAKVLCEKGGSPLRENDDGVSPLQIAQSLRQKTMLHFMLTVKEQDQAEAAEPSEEEVVNFPEVPADDDEPVKTAAELLEIEEEPMLVQTVESEEEKEQEEDLPEPEEKPEPLRLASVAVVPEEPVMVEAVMIEEDEFAI